MNEINVLITILVYSYLVISLIGLVTNILSMIVFSRKKFQNTVFYIYFRFVAFFNILSMIIPINKFFEYNLNIWFRDFSDSLCKFRMYTFYVLQPMLGWSLVAVSIDRYLSIAYPSKFSFRKKTIFQVIVCCSILSYNLCYNIPHLFSYVKRTKQSTNKTNLTIITDRCSNNVYLKDWFNTFSTTIIPFALMFLFTLLTLIKLFQSRKNINNCKTKKRDNRFAMTSISLNIIFLLLNLPYGVFSILIMYISDSMNKTIEKLIYSIIYVPYYSNLVSIFFINIAVNKMFRDEFYKLIFSLNGSKT